MGNSLYCACQPYKEKAPSMNDLDSILKSKQPQELIKEKNDIQVDYEKILEEDHINNFKKEEKEEKEEIDLEKDSYQNSKNSIHQSYFEKSNILTSNEKLHEKLNGNSLLSSKQRTKGIENLKKTLFSTTVDNSSPNSLKAKISIIDEMKSKAFITSKLSIPNFSEFQFSRSLCYNNVPPYQKMQRKLPTEFVMFSEKLIKYNSTLNNNFIPKYGRITDESFQYFKDDNCYLLNKERPFFSIPLNVIENVRIVSFEEIVGKPLFFFEIVAPQLENLKKSSNLMMIHESPSKEIFHRKGTFSQDFSSLKKPAQINPGHLMREVIPGFNDPSKFVQLVEPEKQVLYEGMKFKTEYHLENFLKFKKENQDWLFKPFILKPKVSKEVSGILRSTHSWTYREVDWYNSENSYIFGVTNEKNLKKWVCLLNWVISFKNSNDKL